MAERHSLGNRLKSGRTLHARKDPTVGIYFPCVGFLICTISEGYGQKGRPFGKEGTGKRSEWEQHNCNLNLLSPLLSVKSLQHFSFWSDRLFKITKTRRQHGIITKNNIQDCIQILLILFIQTQELRVFIMKLKKEFYYNTITDKFSPTNMDNISAINITR